MQQKNDELSAKIAVDKEKLTEEYIAELIYSAIRLSSPEVWGLNGWGLSDKKNRTVTLDGSINFAAVAKHISSELAKKERPP